MYRLLKNETERGHYEIGKEILMLSENEKTRLIAAYKGGAVIFYITYVPRRDAIAKTWMCCLSLGKWYAWFRFFGVEIGAKS